MVLEILTSFGYDAVQQSWIVATVLVKYVLFFLGVETYYREGLNLEHYGEVLMENSREFVAFIVFLGVANVFAGFSIQPVFELPSQLIALGYFGYLFWKY